jgi:tetratricopeptide (TPR) repeat protein
MKRPQLVSPGSLNRMFQSAEDCWKRGDIRQCIEILERASRLAPANTDVLLQLGRAHGLRYDYAAAERCFDKAIRLAPNKAEALAAAGRRSLDFVNPNLAERYLRQALDQKDAAPETFARLAELYERINRLEEAAKLVDRALQLDSACARALLARARLDRQAGRLEEAGKGLRALATNADREIRIRAGYELGSVLDRQGRYDEAMAAFLEAKAILRPEAPPLLAQLQTVRARLQEMQAKVSAQMLQRWTDCAPALQPSRRLALLCGHPRSGTTLLEQVLDSHPDIVSAEETQIFLNEAYAPLQQGLPGDPLMLTVLESASVSALQQSRAALFAAMELFLGSPVAGRLLIDKNPGHNFFIPAYIRLFPETKFLVALRDPRDVCLSCFMQAHVALGKESAAYLSLAGTIEEYGSVMTVWRTLAPLIEDRGLEVRYEDMVQDLETVSRRALAFLGVSWDERVLRFDEHARGKMVRSPTYADVKQPVFKRAVGRWRNYQKYLEPHLEKLAPFVKAFGYE